MRRSTRPCDDVTGDAATSNIAGDMVLNSVLATLTDELDQVLVLMHLALGIPIAPLARDLKISRRELQARVDRILTELSRHSDLSIRLSGIRRAGQIEHYYPIIARLGLQNWFCARPGCTNLIIQSKTGRPRKTCKGSCRSRLYRERGTTQQDRHDGDSSPDLDALDTEDHATEDVIAVHDFILQLMRPINYPPPRGYWARPNIHCRDRALLLLGFTCSVPVTVMDLCDLDIGDLGKTSEGLEVKLYKKRKSESTRYITIPASDDPRLCAAQALLSWRRVLAHNGRTTGPLFIRLGSTGYLPKNSSRLSSNAIIQLIWQVLESWGSRIWRYESFTLNKSMPPSNFLKEMMAQAEFRKAVYALELGPDRPLWPDPCEPRNGWLIP